MKYAKIGLFIAGATGVLTNLSAEQSRPNIIFMLSDDQGWGTLGCNGNPAIKTPNIDDMAYNGVNFKNSFVVSSICVVSRASILTGQYMRTHGIRDFNRAFTPQQMSMTYPAILRRAGYFTGFTGKWGVASEQYNYDMYKDEFDFWRGQIDQDLYWRDGKNGRHQNVRMSDDADDFFAKAKDAGKPFCLSISFKAPHGPWDECEPEFFESINVETMPIPETFTLEAWLNEPDFIRNGINGLQAAVARDFKFNKGLNTHHQRLVAQYYALIQGMDAAVGRIRESLKKYGFDDNTILIFTGDNGHFLHEKGLYGKWLMYDPSLRVPLVIYDPRLPGNMRGQIREEAVLNVDIAPTILAMAGIKVPAQMQGSDLIPLFKGEHPEWRHDWFYEHTYSETGNRTIPKSIGVWTPEWKYIRYISETPAYEQLFYTANDPAELKNLAGLSEYKTVLEKFRARCDVLRDEIPDNFPDYQEYPEQYLVCVTGTIKANNPVQFINGRSLAQTFLAETDYFVGCEFILPTWGRGEGPCDLKAELMQGRKILGRQIIDKDDIENVRVQRLLFNVPVEKGSQLCLRLMPTGTVPPQRMAWWAYDKSEYEKGSALIENEVQIYDHELKMIFRK